MSDCSKFFTESLKKYFQIPARETGEVFRALGVSTGFICLGRDQPSGRCSNYIVRYFCKRGNIAFA